MTLTVLDIYQPRVLLEKYNRNMQTSVEMAFRIITELIHPKTHTFQRPQRNKKQEQKDSTRLHRLCSVFFLLTAI